MQEYEKSNSDELNWNNIYQILYCHYYQVLHSLPSKEHVTSDGLNSEMQILDVGAPVEIKCHYTTIICCRHNHDLYNHSCVGAKLQLDTR